MTTDGPIGYTSLTMTQVPQTQTTMPLPGIPLVAQQTVKDDGRLLIYYTFPDDATPAEGAETESAHV